MSLRLRFAVVLITSLAGVATAQAQTTWHVDDDNCPGPGSGTEPDPFCKIQDGIDAASDGDEVLVAPGTYNENTDFLGKNITLQSAEGPQVTIIEAILFSPTVRIVIGKSRAAVLDGFTVTHGNNTVGPGLLISGENAASISNCVFRNNISHNGGGMSIFGPSTAAIADCLFLKNIAAKGGGIWSNTAETLSVTNTMFDSNTATLLGGGMYGGSGSWIVTNCTFAHNSAGFSGGAILNSGINTATFENCRFSLNRSAGRGGAIDHIFGGSSEFDNCEFTANIAHGSGGGGMYNGSGTTVSISSSLFLDNIAAGSGGAINISSFSNTAIQSSTLCGNEPDDIFNLYEDGGGNEFPKECPVTGACCIEGACAALTPAGCASATGVYQGDDAACDEATCSQECPADLDHNGEVRASDLALLLGAWGPCG